MSIADIAERTGIAAGTIRAWEQRYGFPRPARTTGGFRRYSEQDADILRHALALREQGLSVGSALERARATGEPQTDRPSIYAAIAAAGARPLLRKRTLLALSRAIEDEAMARAAAPICFAAFQEEGFYRAVEHRYCRLAQTAEATVVFADFPALREAPEGPIEVPIAPADALGNEWAVIMDAPGFAACLLAWEPPSASARGGPDDGMRRFESLWTTDPEVTRRAALVAARLAARGEPTLGSRLERALLDRPLAAETPAPVLTALTNRTIEYLEQA